MTDNEDGKQSTRRAAAAGEEASPQSAPRDGENAAPPRPERAEPLAPAAEGDPPADARATDRAATARAQVPEPAVRATEEAGGGGRAESGRPRTGEPRRGKGLALLALLLAGLSLLAAGYLWWEAERAAGARDQTAAERGEALADLRGALESQAAVLEQLGRRDDDIEASIAAREADLAELTSRLRAAERALRERGGPSDTAREAMLRTEIEQSLRIANRAAQLARDPATALAALRIADDRLRELEDPALLPVREQLSAEIDALEALPELDIEGIALRLARMAARVDDLPLRPLIGEAAAPASEAPGQAPGFWNRAWASVRGALSSLVRVRRSDEPVTPLLAPGQEFFLRQNLRLELATARLAALRGDADNYAASLRSAREWLTEYFDTRHASVGGMVDALRSLGEAEVDADLPDLSGSFNALSEIGREDG